MFSATNLCPQHLRKGKTVDQHQDDDGRYRHANHADAEDSVRDRLAREVLQKMLTTKKRYSMLSPAK